MSTLCTLMREKFYREQIETDLLLDFYSDIRPLPGLALGVTDLLERLHLAALQGAVETSDLGTRLLPVLDTIQELLPGPESFVFLPRGRVNATPDRVQAVRQSPKALKMAREVVLGCIQALALEDPEWTELVDKRDFVDILTTVYVGSRLYVGDPVSEPLKKLLQASRQTRLDFTQLETYINMFLEFPADKRVSVRAGPSVYKDKPLPPASPPLPLASPPLPASPLDLSILSGLSLSPGDLLAAPPLSPPLLDLSDLPDIPDIPELAGLSGLSPVTHFSPPPPASVQEARQ